MIENPYKVIEKDIKVGTTFFIMIEDEFKEVLIGPGTTDVCNMVVNFDGKKHRVLLQELWSEVPKGWKGKVRYL